MSHAILDEGNIAITAGNITVYNYDGVTREYLSSTVEFLPVGVGLPAHSCTDAPDASKENYAVCRTTDFTDWEYVTDHRGETVYRTQTGEAMTVTTPGGYPDGTTTLAPATPYDVWQGNEWVTDTDAQHSANVSAAEQQKTALLTQAQATISLWQSELQLGMISEEDKARLIAWMIHIKAVQATDTSAAPDIHWPLEPEV